MRIPRPVRIAFLLTEDEAGRLRKVATKAGMTVSDWLREQIREAGKKT